MTLPKLTCREAEVILAAHLAFEEAGGGRAEVYYADEDGNFP